MIEIWLYAEKLVFNENNPSWSMKHTRVSLSWSVDVTVKQYPNDLSFDSVIGELAEEMGVFIVS